MMKKLHHRSSNETYVGANVMCPYCRISPSRCTRGNRHE
jgi:hypothetical protein